MIRAEDPDMASTNLAGGAVPASAKAEPTSPNLTRTLLQIPRKCGGQLRYLYRDRLRRLRERLGQIVLAKAHRSRSYSLLYYAFFNPAFHWEIFSTASAVQAYHNRLQRGDRSSVLRRNAHRLEKGLIMRPRRPVFGLDFIEETTDQFARRVARPRQPEEEGELAWAAEVLQAYFTTVEGQHQEVQRARAAFEEGCKSGQILQRDVRPRIPYHRDLKSPPTVTYDALRELALRRRSTRWFLQKAVPRVATKRAAAIATQSPSACNRQPFELRIFDEPRLAAEIASLAPGTRGFCQNIPAVAVIVGRLDSYFSESDRHLIYIDSSLAAMGFMYGLEAQGLSSCPINWPDAERRERKIAAKLGLEPYQRVIMLIAYGYPDHSGMVAYSQKKSPDELCRFNELRSDDGGKR